MGFQQLGDLFETPRLIIDDQDFLFGHGLNARKLYGNTLPLSNARGGGGPAGIPGSGGRGPLSRLFLLVHEGRQDHGGAQHEQKEFFYTHGPSSSGEIRIKL
jgi:hypothetical protein